MKSNMTRFIMVILAAILLMPSKAYAVDLIDFDQKGSLSVTITDQDKQPVSGAEVTIYKVADIVPDQVTGYKVVISDDFAAGKFDLLVDRDDLGDSALTQDLENYVSRNKILGEECKSDDNGQVTWSNMDLGIYFLTNTVVTDEYTKVSSFCVTIPSLIGENYIYDVQATPKSTEVIPKPPTPEPPPMPQTGQVWWPLPVLVTFGCCFIGIGVIKKRHTDAE